MKTIYFLLMIVLPFSTFASGGGEAIILIWGLQITLFLWPLVLPLFFIKSQESKVKNYFSLVVIIYGVIGLLNLPFNFFTQFAIWFNLPIEFYNLSFSIGVHVVSFFASLFLLRKYSEGIANIFIDNSQTTSGA